MESMTLIIYSKAMQALAIFESNHVSVTEILKPAIDKFTD